MFHLVLSEDYSTKIARDCNVGASGVGYATRRQVKSFMDRYQIQHADGRTILEYGLSAEDLDDVNENIVGTIEVVAECR